MANLKYNFSLYCEKLIPRLLTQVCRDSTSKLYGSFDRNWWHYKIRDFPSIILQQGAYTLSCADNFFPNQTQKESVREIISASARFWNKQAQKHGAFEEYYPWEQGYPPLSFSTLAIVKLLANKHLVSYKLKLRGNPE